MKNKKWFRKNATVKTLRRYCQELWRDIVIRRDGGRCVLCGETSYLNAHHLISAKCRSTRFEPLCGLSLCAKHHKLSLESVHVSPWVVYEFLEKHRPEQYAWFLENRKKITFPLIGKLDKAYYMEILDNLKTQYLVMFPAMQLQNKYFFLSENEEKQICEEYKTLKPIHDIAMLHRCKESLIKSVLKRYNVWERNRRKISKFIVEQKEKPKE